jgi:transcription initiation factor IIE alpha subunit
MIYYKCPNCDYRITQEECSQTRYDMDCPRCSKVPFSEFRGRIYEDATTTDSHYYGVDSASTD